MPQQKLAPSIVLEEYLLTQGPSKVATIVADTGISETTVRTLLKTGIANGCVKKNDDSTYEWIVVKKKRARNTENMKGAAVRDRDNLVLSYVQRLASKDDESISRDELVKRLAKDGHVFTGSFVYLSLFRLHSAGEIERVHVGKRAPEWRIARH